MNGSRLLFHNVEFNEYLTLSKYFEVFVYRRDFYQQKVSPGKEKWLHND